MTTDPPDEPATLDRAPRGWTREDTDALINATLIRDGWSDNTAFLPLSPEDTERQLVQRNAVGAVITWDNIVAIYQRMLPGRMQPNRDPWSIAAAHAAGLLSQDWDLTPPGAPPILATEHPFPIRYAAHVWEQLHPHGEPRERLPRQTLYVTEVRARTRK